MKHGTTQCANLSAIVTNALTNVTSFHPHEIQRESEDPSLILCQPGGPTILIVTSSLNTEGKQRSIAHPLPTWREPTMVIRIHPHRYILTEYRGKEKIHRPSSASLEGTNDVSRSYKHQHLSQCVSYNALYLCV